MSLSVQVYLTAIRPMQGVPLK